MKAFKDWIKLNLLIKIEEHQLLFYNRSRKILQLLLLFRLKSIKITNKSYVLYIIIVILIKHSLA